MDVVTYIIPQRKANKFSGTEEECREYIRKALRAHRRIQGQQHDGTFLAVRDAKTYEWVK